MQIKMWDRNHSEQIDEAELDGGCSVKKEIVENSRSSWRWFEVPLLFVSLLSRGMYFSSA